jgi:hypothetical protein
LRTVSAHRRRSAMLAGTAFKKLDTTFTTGIQITL